MGHPHVILFCLVNLSAQFRSHGFKFLPRLNRGARGMLSDFDYENIAQRSVQIFDYYYVSIDQLPLAIFTSLSLLEPFKQVGNCRPTALLQQCLSSPRPFQNHVAWPLRSPTSRPSLRLLNANCNCFGSRRQSICKVLLSSILDHAPFLCSSNSLTVD